MGSAVRQRRWAGPPPLLVLATVLAFVLAPVFSGSDTTHANESSDGVQASLASDVVQEIPPIGAQPPARARAGDRAPRPARRGDHEPVP